MQVPCSLKSKGRGSGTRHYQASSYYSCFCKACDLAFSVLSAVSVLSIISACVPIHEGLSPGLLQQLLLPLNSPLQSILSVDTGFILLRAFSYHSSIHKPPVAPIAHEINNSFVQSFCAYSRGYKPQRLCHPSQRAGLGAGEK